MNVRGTKCVLGDDGEKIGMRHHKIGPEVDHPRSHISQSGAVKEEVLERTILLAITSREDTKSRRVLLRPVSCQSVSGVFSR